VLDQDAACVAIRTKEERSVCVASEEFGVCCCEEGSVCRIEESIGCVPKKTKTSSANKPQRCKRTNEFRHVLPMLACIANDN